MYAYIYKYIMILDVLLCAHHEKFFNFNLNSILKFFVSLLTPFPFINSCINRFQFSFFSITDLKWIMKYTYKLWSMNNMNIQQHIWKVLMLM